MAEIGYLVVSKISELLLGPIRRKISYVFNYQRYVEDLRGEVFGELDYVRERVQLVVNHAKIKGDVVYEDVQDWLIRVDEFTGEVKTIIDDEGDANMRCFRGMCPNLFKRYNLSKQAVKAAGEGSDLLGKGCFSTVSYRPAPRWTEPVPITDHEQFESRMSTFRGIMEALNDNEIKVIGVYGMGGVGKTTLVKQVARQAMEDKLVDTVVMVSVTQTPSLEAIQRKIADCLGLKLTEDESVHLRADRLYHRLKKEKRVLVILDDIWEALDLHKVGIPHGDDEKEIKDDQSQCTLLLTSRRLDVLGHADTHKYFNVEVLSDQEAVILFEKVVGDVAKTSDFQPIATDIVRECGGLPIAIMTIAGALKNKNIPLWKDALYQLRSHMHISTMYANVYSSITLSYDFLNEEAKSIFLLCGLLNDGSRIPINGLMSYGMGLGLFSNVSSLETARNRMYAVIDILKASCLLSDGDTDDDVKMHDIIHDVAVSISRDKLMFNIQNVAYLKKKLEDTIQKDPIAISLHCRDIQELPERLECPNLKLFLLFSKKLSLQIPDLFFEGMTELQVLELNGIHFPSLPSSLSCLINLQTLSFECCVLGDVAIVGDLKKLMILSFRNSHIEQLPEEIGQLTRLKLLDLSNCLKLKVIRPNVIARLPRLEELYIGNSFTHWEIKGHSYASLAELKQLSRLSTLEMHILDAQVMPQDLLSVELERYRIFIGDVWSWSGKCETSRTLKLKLDNSIYLGHGIKMLLKRTEDLHLDMLNGFHNVLHEFDREGFPQLKHLLVQNASEILYIVKSVEGFSCNVFPLLQSLSLHNLMNLEKLCHEQLADNHSFSNLRMIKVQNCGKLKHLCSVSVARNLLKLQELEVSDCKSLEMIVGEESENHVYKNESVSGINFACLHSLILRELPKLTSLGFNVETPATSLASKEIIADDDCNEALFNNKVNFPRLEKLELFSTNIEKIWPDRFLETPSGSQYLTNLIVDCCSGLKFLLSSSVVNSLVRLEELKIRNCESIEGVVDDTMLGREEKMIVMVFPKLVYLELKGLPKLTRFGTGNSVQFPSLLKLSIDDCPNLERFISSCTCAEEVSKGDNIHTTQTQSLFDDKVELPSLEVLMFNAMKSLRNIWEKRQLAFKSFRKLKDLDIRHCDKLLNIFPADMLRNFERLEHLSVISCDSLEEISEISSKYTVDIPRVVFPQLISLKLHWLPSVKNLCSEKHISEWPVLKSLEVFGCDKLEIFASEVLALQGIHHESQHSLFLVDKCAFPSLQKLKLSELPELLHLYTQNSHSSTIFQNLETLEISECCKLEELVPSSVSFQNLTTMEVSKCDGLMNLMTLSTAAKLVKLARMHIIDCKRLEQIIEQFGIEEKDRIVFSQLKHLGLHCLPSLASFCLGKYTLDFPSMEHLIVRECPKMTTFSVGDLHTPCLRRLRLSEEEEEGCWEGNLNDTIQRLFKEMNSKVED